MPKKERQEKEADEDAEERFLYEVGYHLVPLLGEEALPMAVGKVREAIEGAGGMPMSDQFPAMHPLAYEMSRPIGGKRQTFSEAYFGWTQFESTSGSVGAMKAALDRDENLLRFILVHAPKEAPLAIRTAPIVQSAEESKGSEPAEEKKIIPPTEEERLSEEELDKTIEGLVIE